MRRWALAAGAALAVLGCAAAAQNVPLVVAPQVSVLTIKQQSLFEESAFGRASLLRIENLSRALQAENRSIEAALEAEERSLTDRRPSLPAEEFRALAAVFDEKVEGIRSAQEAKAREVSRQREQDQATFFENAGPVLAELVRAKGAVLLIDQAAVVLSLDAIDITAEAIAEIDSRLAPPPAITPDPVIVPAPAPADPDPVPQPLAPKPLPPAP